MQLNHRFIDFFLSFFYIYELIFKTRTRERLTALMFACGKQAGLSRLPLNRSASVSENKIK